MKKLFFILGLLAITSLSQSQTSKTNTKPSKATTKKSTVKSDEQKQIPDSIVGPILMEAVQSGTGPTQYRPLHIIRYKDGTSRKQYLDQ